MNLYVELRAVMPCHTFGGGIGGEAVLPWRLADLLADPMDRAVEDLDGFANVLDGLANVLDEAFLGGPFG